MKHYIDSILPKIKRYSARFSNMALFVDHPWVQVDDSKDRIVYVFRSKEHELLVSVNGDVKMCRWEYLEYMNSLLIDVGDSKVLYNQGFLDETVMILKKDGTDEYMMLVNENKIADFSIDHILAILEKKYLIKPVPVLEKHDESKLNSALESHEFRKGGLCARCRVSRAYVIDTNYFCPKTG